MPGRHSYTVKCADEKAAIEVLLRGRAFYAKRFSVNPEEKPQRTYAWGLWGGPQKCWDKVKNLTAFDVA